MNEKQKIIFEQLVEIYHYYVGYYPDDNNNVICTIAKTMDDGLSDTDFIPALQAFLREVEADEFT